MLAKKPHPWIPGGIPTIQKPAEIRREGQHQPDWLAKRAGQRANGATHAQPLPRADADIHLARQGWFQAVFGR